MARTSSSVKPKNSSNFTSEIEQTFRLLSPVKMLSFDTRRQPVKTAKNKLLFVLSAA